MVTLQNINTETTLNIQTNLTPYYNKFPKQEKICMGLVMRKPVFRVSNQVTLKLACSAIKETM